MKKFNKKTLTGLSKDERRAVVAMIILLFTEQENSKNLNLIIGDSADKLIMWHCNADYKKQVCEQLVEKGIFCRQLGDDDPVRNTNAPVGEDNWYSFNTDFVNVADDNSYFDVIGDFIAELEHHEAREYRRKIYSFAVCGLLQSTYL